ncbi:MAG: hypothetical protein P8K68_14155 [Algibacter sp.]|uniref:hypothetical protein n=1 Tax=Algibacter sp. TaxID=1872428 RepID=UPI002637ACC2|nr:hypothetical protein [Algibacter sp.]MDG1731002.1 hypothetical protein [Algibacter sp.]MDG2179909.1 hypothetical protein [Algibacter sp.]
MKKVLILLVCISAFLSCKKDIKSQQSEDTISNDDSEKTAKQNDGLTLLKGEFVYYDGAAVLQTHAEIYGILITDKLEALNNQAQQYKTEPTDMVQVEIRGKITNQKDEKILWENKVEVVEILSIKASPKDENKVIKLGNQ